LAGIAGCHDDAMAPLLVAWSTAVCKATAGVPPILILRLMIFTPLVGGVLDGFGSIGN